MRFNTERLNSIVISASRKSEDTIQPACFPKPLLHIANMGLTITDIVCEVFAQSNTTNINTKHYFIL